MLKRDGKQIIRKPIESLEDPSTPVSSDSSSRESSLTRPTTGLREDSQNDDLGDSAKRRQDSVGTESKASCKGPRLASALPELVNILEEGPPDRPAVAAISECCCDIYSPQLRMVNSLLGDLKRVVSLVEATVKHTIRGAELGSVQSYAPTLPDAM